MQDNADKKILAPVLDRLLEKNKHTDFTEPHQVLRQLKESVRRDLEYLFNTRYRCLKLPEGSVHAEKSNMNYGLPDLSTENLSSSGGRRDFCKTIEKAILNFDPRFKSVRVSTEDKVDDENPSIRFKVEATLHANPSPEVIVFNSSVNPINQTVDVSEIS